MYEMREHDEAEKYFNDASFAVFVLTI